MAQVIPRLAFSLLIFLCTFFALSFVVSAQNFPLQVEVQRSANLRSGPGTSFAIVGSAQAGDVFTATGCNEACDWYDLGDDKWIAAFLVEMVDTSTPITVQPTITVAPTLTPTVLPTFTPTPDHITPSYQELVARNYALDRDGGDAQAYRNSMIGKQIRDWRGAIGSVNSSMFMRPKDYWLWISMSYPLDIPGIDRSEQVKVMISEELASTLQAGNLVIFSAEIVNVWGWGGSLNLEVNATDLQVTQALPATQATATRIAEATAWTEIVGTATPTPVPTITPISTVAWYSGGTLHDATWAEWSQASEANKLATAADWITNAYKPEWQTLTELRFLSNELIACLKEVEEVAIASYGEDSAITDFVVMCIILMME